jgi:hypothetical protein
MIGGDFSAKKFECEKRDPTISTKTLQMKGYFFSFVFVLFWEEKT